MNLHGFLNVLEIVPGFVFPIFVGDKTKYYVQIIDGTKVTGFNEKNIEPSLIVKVEDAQNINVGDEAIFAYQLSNKTFYYGTNDELIIKLKRIENRIEKKSLPALLEVMRFIGCSKPRELEILCEIEATTDSRLTKIWATREITNIKNELSPIIIESDPIFYRRPIPVSHNTHQHRNNKLVEIVKEVLKTCPEVTVEIKYELGRPSWGCNRCRGTRVVDNIVARTLRDRATARVLGHSINGEGIIKLAGSGHRIQKKIIKVNMNNIGVLNEIKERIINVSIIREHSTPIHKSYKHGVSKHK